MGGHRIRLALEVDSLSPEADFEQWLVAYSTFTVERDHADLPCPHCGVTDELHLVFGVAAGEVRGRAEFWCNSCLVGVRLYGARVVEGYAAVALDASIDEHRRVVPDFAVVVGLT
jgi:hypothetical protein